MKIANIRSLYLAAVPRANRKRTPTPLEMQRAYHAAKKYGCSVADDGRCYMPFKVSSPLLEDGTHGRWEKGRVVPRKRA